MGVIFCSFSEAVQDHPELVKQYLGSVVPHTDNFFAALNSAVFSDGSFVFVPEGRALPDGAVSTYFRINAKETGQFERTLIVCRRRARYVSYLEGCTAPMRDENQLHAAVVELVALDRRHHQVLHRPELVSRRQGRQGRHLQLRHQARALQGAALQDHLDPGRDRVGDHLEVPELHPAGRRLGRRVLLGRGHEQPAAGRHRHQDDPPREEHPQHHRVEGDLGRARPEHLPRRGEDRQGRDQRAQLLAVRLAAHRRQAAARTPSRTSRSRTPRRRSSTRPRRRRSARTRCSTASSAASRRKTPST